MFLPCAVHVSCSTWYREVNMFRIFMICVSWINGQEEYCLSCAQILTSRYQSIVDNRVKIERTSNVEDVMECPTLNDNIVLLRRINKIVSRVSLKSSEVKDSSRIIKAILISPFSNLLLLPNKISNDHQTNAVLVKNDFEDKI